MHRQQRKNPVKRLYNRLVGLPPEAEAAPASPVAPPSEPTPDLQRRPGRPTKHADAAAKQAAYRARKAENLADAERRNLVAELMKIYRRMQPDIVAEKSRPADIARVVKLRGENRVRLRKVHDDMLALSLESLQKVLTTWKETPDSHGRLRNERSGEDERKHGMSELERIIAGQQNATGKVTPEGHGVDAFEQDDDSDSSDTRPPSGPRIPPEHKRYLDGREHIISELIMKYTKKEGSGVRCLLCREVQQDTATSEGVSTVRYTYPVVIADPSDVRQHFWEEYEKGLQLFYRYQELSEDPGVAELAQFMVADARRAYQNNKHLEEVWKVVREQRKGIS
jgi:hypothetical protein